MVNWNTINQYKSPSKDNPIHTVGYRYGSAPKDGQSYNTRDNQHEAGVSMASVAGLPECRSFATMSSRDNRKKAYYEGDVVGFGGDDEPLVVNIKAITKQIYDRLVTGSKTAALRILAHKVRNAKAAYNNWSDPFPYTGINPHTSWVQETEEAFNEKLEDR